MRRAATARKTGQRCERRPDTAAIADEIVKCARSDIVAADETKPVELRPSIDLFSFSAPRVAFVLLLGDPHCGLDLGHVVPILFNVLEQMAVEIERHSD